MYKRHQIFSFFSSASGQKENVVLFPFCCFLFDKPDHPIPMECQVARATQHGHQNPPGKSVFSFSPSSGKLAPSPRRQRKRSITICSRASVQASSDFQFSCIIHCACQSTTRSDGFLSSGQKENVVFFFVVFLFPFTTSGAKCYS